MPIMGNWGEAGDEREREAALSAGKRRSRCLSGAKVRNICGTCKIAAERQETGNVNDVLKVKGFLTECDKQKLTQVLKSLVAVKKADLTLINRDNADKAQKAPAAQTRKARATERGMCGTTAAKAPNRSPSEPETT